MLGRNSAARRLCSVAVIVGLGRLQRRLRAGGPSSPVAGGAGSAAELGGEQLQVLEVAGDGAERRCCCVETQKASAGLWRRCREAMLPCGDAEGFSRAWREGFSCGLSSFPPLLSSYLGFPLFIDPNRAGCLRDHRDIRSKKIVYFL
ncbi:hypothetical protein J5N97_001198 [Dioscorea zingiberensis]|uniref:Uncharacterized protein n=1 Tax=Dioscorea zingiberensis TaxID=325984 RepID=A0A9D5H2E6_9LILI|nr:hypothetical protein J5N97_001198 [Dioscorea zingiberensis]